MDPPPSLLQSDLLTIKHTADPATLFPSHAYGRGGVGTFLCTGQSRVGLHRLPQALAQPASLSVPTRRRLESSRSARSGGEECSAGSSTVSGFSLISTDPVSIGATRAWETGGVQHTHNFVASSRTVRPQDVPSASKWAAISFFENDPRQVARHMAIMDYVQARHEESMVAERQAEQARHSMWAEQQREMFRRQRLEQAARYARSGIRPRSAYADLGAVEAAEEAHGVGAAEPGLQEGAGDGPAVRAASAGGGGSTGCTRDPTERFFRSEQVRSTLSSPGSAGPLYGTVGGRVRPSTAGMTSASGRLFAAGGTLRSMGGSSTHSLVGGAAAVGLGGGQASGGGAWGGGRTFIPLPKKTYVSVHERMAAEALEVPAARAAAVAAARARVEEDKAQAALVDEMQGLDSFEARMRSLQRARSRAARSQRQRPTGSGSVTEGESDDG